MEDDKKRALGVLGSFIDSVLEGDYHQKRYEGSTHLAKIFGSRPDLQKAWPEDVEKPLEEYLRESGKINFDPQAFIRDKLLIFDHLPKGRYEILFKFLGANSEQLEGILKELNASLAQLAETASKNKRRESDLRKALAHLAEIEQNEGNEEKKANLIQKFLVKQLKEQLPEELAKVNTSNLDYINVVKVHAALFKKAAEEELLKIKAGDEDRKRNLLQKDIIDLYRSQQASLSQRLNQLVKIQTKLNELDRGVEFLNDINGMVKALTSQKQSFEGYTMVNTDKFDLMLLCGTQVQGSCQRIDGDPDLNKCLLAYLMDGKHRLLAIKDRDGKIVARSIFRLLWDAQQKRPSLMLEPVYSNVPDDSLTKALGAFAKDQAKRLGLDCYVPWGQGDAQLESFGSGEAPWEYVDSAKGVKPDGIYTITNAAIFN